MRVSGAGCPQLRVLLTLADLMTFRFPDGLTPAQMGTPLSQVSWRCVCGVHARLRSRSLAGLWAGAGEGYGPGLTWFALCIHCAYRRPRGCVSITPACMHVHYVCWTIRGGHADMPGSTTWATDTHLSSTYHVPVMLHAHACLHFWNVSDMPDDVVMAIILILQIRKEGK